MNNEEIEHIEEQEEVIDDSAKEREIKFQSPVPFLRQLRNLIFGKTPPDAFTRITFYMNVVIWTTFTFWHILSYLALTSEEIFSRNKGVPVEAIVERRGAELGFAPGDFIARLSTFHAIAVICFLILFIGLILLYRRMNSAVYFILGPLVFYVGMSIFYLSFRYYLEDTTTFDKVALLIMVISTLIHSYVIRNGKADGYVSFFGLGSGSEEDQ